MKRYKVYTKEKGLIETNYYDDVSNLTLHREDGPAIIYYKNGLVECKEYWINGNRNRLDGPAFIRYDYNGSIEYVEYWFNGKTHRLNGPARIYYNNNCKLTEYYYIDNELYAKDQYYKELLKLKLNSL